MKKICVIGGGHFGAYHIKNWQRLSKDNKCIFVGVVEKSKLQAETIKKQFDCLVVNSVDEIIDQVDGCDIVTPAATHYEIAKKCLENKKNVLIEKPMTSTFEESMDLYKISHEKKLCLMVGHTFRYDPMTKIAYDYIQKNIDNTFLIEGEFVNPGEPRQDVGVISNFVHWIDICNYILNDSPQSVMCSAFKKPESKFEDDALVILNYRNNVQARIHLGWIGQKKSRNLMIKGSNSTIVLEYNNRTTEKFFEIDGNFESHLTKVELSPDTEPLFNELLDFLNYMENEINPISDAYSGILASYVVKKAQESIIKNSTVKCDFKPPTFS